MSDRLRDRVAIVTGAGRGIGRAIAMSMAAEGAALVVNDLGGAVDGGGGGRDVADATVAEIAAAGGRAAADYGDVADFAAAERLVEETVARFGRVDILVNNAGILRNSRIFDVSEEEFALIVGVNLKGTFNCTRHASAQMRRQNFGRIINLTSTGGLYGYPGLSAYGAAKDGIAGMTRVVARDLGKYAITVNALAPVANTRMADAVRASLEKRESTGGSVDDLSPAAVAPLATYLATDAAAGINGQTFGVFGGVISLMNDPAPLRTMTKSSRWTAQEIAAVFPHTLGLDLLKA